MLRVWCHVIMQEDHNLCRGKYSYTKICTMEILELRYETASKPFPEHLIPHMHARLSYWLARKFPAHAHTCDLPLHCSC